MVRVGSIERRQQEFIELFNELDDWLLQYELLLQAAGEMSPYPHRHKSEAYLVSGCQSKAWLYCTCEDDVMRIYADSEALIIKGMIGTVIEMVDGSSPREISDTTIDFIEKTVLREQITVDRFNGMQSVIACIQDFARKHAGKEGI